MSEASPLPNDIPEIFQASRASPTRLVHLIPDQLAEEVPNHVLFTIAKTPRPEDGFAEVTARQFAVAVNRASWFLRDLLGPAENFETVGYMGPNDLRYFFLMFGAIKVGYKMLFLSPRNTLDGHLNVLERVDCQILFSGKDTRVDDILLKRPMRTSLVPELAEFLDASPVKTYPYAKTFDEARLDPCLVLHTTGSTGLPKPITWKNGNLSSYEAWRTIPCVHEYVPTTVIYQEAKRAYTSMPLFHTSGLNAGITWSLLLGVTLVYGFPGIVPNAEYTDRMHMHAGVDASMGAPSIYEDLARSPESLSRLKDLHYVIASGAPLSQAAGNVISKHTRIISNLGSTETSCLQRLAPAIDDWSYFYWHPTHSGIQMREHEDGLFELFLVPVPGLELYQGIFATFPDVTEWSMSDLYERHPDPEKPFLYRYVGRVDDVIVLSNGEKVAPALMEAALNSSPLVRGSMIVGRGKFQPAALLDLRGDPPRTPAERHQVIAKLLPFVGEANRHAPAHGKLDRHHILFASPRKPICYLGQGKIQRVRTYQTYETEIEKLYHKIEAPDTSFNAVQVVGPTLGNLSERAVVKHVGTLLADVAGIHDLDPGKDIFEAGVDSLQVMQLATEIRLAFRGRSAKPCVPRDIYAHPTVGGLSKFLAGRVRRPSTNVTSRAPGDGAQLNGGATAHPMDHMRFLLDKYVASLPRLSPTACRRPEEGITVLLTGSTGSLGSYLLDALYKNSNVRRVICLNRSPDAAERHRRAGSSRGLFPLRGPRVEFFQANLAKPRLELSEDVYADLVGSVTHIIHNQWPVNFNWALSSFEPHIRGVRNLIRLSSESTYDAFILFVSSVSAVGSWSGPESAPEEAIHDMAAAAPMGYGRSKLVAECLLDEAVRTSGVHSACCRVGIVAGPVGTGLGMWNTHEYIPSIVVSSVHMGAFPATFTSRDVIDWLPVNKVPTILLEILASASRDQLSIAPQGTEVFHVTNPNVKSWSNEFATCVVSLFSPNEMRLVPFAEWLTLLRESAKNAAKTGKGRAAAERNPAVLLIDFLNEVGGEAQGPRVLKHERAEAASPELGSVGPVNKDWMQNWMRQWGILEG